MEYKKAEIINAIPSDGYDYVPKNKLDKKGAILSIGFALSILAIASFYVPLIRNIGVVITIAACGYSLYNLYRVIR